MPNWCDNSLTITGPKDQVDRAVKAAQEGRLFEEFVPIGSWDYHKAIDAWSCKWDVPADEYHIQRSGGEKAQMGFMSAWSPPISVYRAMQEAGLTVDASYHEGGMCFYGYFNEEVGDQCLGYKTFEEIPDDIIDTFGLEDYSQEFES